MEISKKMKEAKKGWIEEHYNNIDKRLFQEALRMAKITLKTLTKTSQLKASVIADA
ncbi:hypothetical protein DPMN_142671 [Dreissena polymorpha]|uniref:Uncharacterized protein n=1 Tax=Dreissena polymorpha TaxID=45954 RepID=A0A9D4JNN7_DREPO|nr:hypothetical protein DPMN_142671 [Dreissena polymorpha]